MYGSRNKGEIGKLNGSVLLDSKERFINTTTKAFHELTTNEEQSLQQQKPDGNQ